MLDRGRSRAFVVSGAIWITGAALGLRIPTSLAVIAAAYVVVGTLALDRAQARTGLTLVVLWAAAVVLMSAVFDSLGVGAIVVGVLYGTLCFGAWIATGFLLWHFFAHGRSAARP